MKHVRAKLLCNDGLVFLRCMDEDLYELRFLESLPKPPFYKLRFWLSRWIPFLFPRIWQTHAIRLTLADAMRLGLR